jgi:hypothetical protein
MGVTAKDYPIITYHTSTKMYGHRHNLNEYAIRAWLDVCEKGFGWSTYKPFPDNSRAVYAYDLDLNKIVGIIVYSIDEDERKAMIHVGHTHPDYRKQNIYNTLYTQMCEIVYCHNVTVVESIIHPDNHTMMSLAKSQSRDIVGYTMRHKLDGVKHD